MKFPASVYCFILIAVFAVITPRVETAVAATTYVCPGGLSANATVVLDNRCYAYYSTARTWSAARTACQSLTDGDLVQIRSNLMNETVQNLIPGDAWIGATDSATEGNFFWVGDDISFWEGGQGGVTTNSQYSRWDPATNEPNNQGGNEDCGHMRNSNGFWNDLGCTDTMAYVCEIDLDVGTVTTTPSNSNGLRAVSLDLRIQNALKSQLARRNGSPIVKAAPVQVTFNKKLDRPIRKRRVLP